VTPYQSRRPPPPRGPRRHSPATVAGDAAIGEPGDMIEANRITKQRGGRTVVSDVTFRCEPGTVTGFLGPNGAGKTTTMRMLVGLSAPDSGEARILGKRYRDLPNPGRRVGILLDASAQHAGRRGREALAISAQTMGVPAQRVDALLALVGLDAAAARRRVGRYSLGMRQRLGLAHALLGDPEVLILDEPANGLDPEGMRWMRELLRGFADRGGTVLLSSHLLAEVEAVADRMMIIGGGRIQAQGSRAELLTESGTVVEAADLAGLDAALRHAGLVAQRIDGDRRLVEAEPEAVARAALAGGVVLHRLAPADGEGLERLFFALTATGAGASPSPIDPIHAELAGAPA
jgi:ABC-2 type transport system ATP-binding protein